MNEWMVDGHRSQTHTQKEYKARLRLTEVEVAVVEGGKEGEKTKEP